MKKMINQAHFEGYLYEVDLTTGTYKTGERIGKNYLRGRVSIQIADNDVVNIDFFEGEVTTKGAENPKYKSLVEVMNSPSIVKDGIDNACGIRIDSALDINDWYDKKTKTVVSTLRAMGGFIHVKNRPEKFEATFKLDMLITSTTDELVKDKEGEMVPSGNLIVNGCFFDWRQQIYNAKFVVESDMAIDYFKNLEPNTFTCTEGEIHNRVYKTIKTEKSAFGEDKVTEYTKTRKSYVLTWAAGVPYEFGEEGVLTLEEVQGCLAERKIHLEEIKTKGEQGNVAAPATNASATTDIKNAVFDL